MIDPTPNECAALAYASEMGGEYLDSLGLTDLAQLSPDQWQTFLRCIIGGYGARLQELAAQDTRHLAQLSEGVPF